MAKLSAHGREVVATFVAADGTKIYLCRSRSGRMGWIMYRSVYVREYESLPAVREYTYRAVRKGPWEAVRDLFLRVAEKRAVEWRGAP